ncbi:uncharacterized protein LOC129916545 [Episyrphus balteatus]|uniref:uncharacterized protein LOC129916545 n=1 Tax=Episyrphus balteatus TaxID=286459 RepID=UPI0024867760|nr:uncharacterized protein LOC129916545 [Episyrphus balteatus]
MRSALLCLLISAVAISADLQSDIEDVASHFPVKEIESIGKQYVAAYSSYADGLRYVQKVTYEKLIKDFLETKEGRDLIEYFNDREIDAKTIILFMGKKTTEMVDKWLEPIKDGEELNPIISGNIMADYTKAVLASDYLDAVYEKMQSSSELANLVAALKDPEFQARFYSSANSKGLKAFGKNPAVRGAIVNFFK